MNVFDRYAWFWFGSILAVSGLPFRFADRLQLSEKIVGEKTRVGIVRVIGPTVGLYLFGGAGFSGSTGFGSVFGD